MDKKSQETRNERAENGAFTTRALARAGIIAALYVALTYVFGPLAYGPLQIRPAEALCILPIFFIEAVPGLFVGCALANLLSGYGIYDIAFGSLITLIAALCTYFIGRLLKGNYLSALLGAVPPILFNAIGIPFIIILVGEGETMESYFIYFLQLLLTQSVWIYGLGFPLYIGVKRLRKGGARALL
ncbi:MAG: QueT transporter family protein [Clostridia bacterium]|nr:QueT transporter family protein [Clostridia bacterium]